MGLIIFSIILIHINLVYFGAHILPTSQSVLTIHVLPVKISFTNINFTWKIIDKDSGMCFSPTKKKYIYYLQTEHRGNLLLLRIISVPVSLSQDLYNG